MTNYSKLILGIIIMLISSTLIINCNSDDEEPILSDKITSLEDFLTIICKNASMCPELISTQDEIDICPTELMNELGASDIEQLESFFDLDKVKQDCIIDCLTDRICGRFSSSILNISDSDLMEPYDNCLIDC